MKFEGKPGGKPRKAVGSPYLDDSELSRKGRGHQIALRARTFWETSVPEDGKTAEPLDWRKVSACTFEATFLNKFGNPKSIVDAFRCMPHAVFSNQTGTAKCRLDNIGSHEKFMALTYCSLMDPNSRMLTLKVQLTPAEVCAHRFKQVLSRKLTGGHFYFSFTPPPMAKNNLVQRLLDRPPAI